MPRFDVVEEARRETAYRKWVIGKSMTKEELADAYLKWANELEDELIRRTGLNLDSFLSYPYGEVFILEQLTPSEAASQMIDVENIKEINNRPFFIVQGGREKQTVNRL
jgi:hypothetical protein